MIIDILAIILFFLVAFIPSQIEAYLNTGHFIVTPGLVILPAMISLFIYMFGRIARWLKENK